jgi:hypothetical protein
MTYHNSNKVNMLFIDKALGVNAGYLHPATKTRVSG